MKFRLVESLDKSVVVYRVGEVPKDTILTNDRGIFFTDDLAYYKDSATGHKVTDAKRYLLHLEGCKLFDPMNEIPSLYVDSGWSDIRGKMSDFERYGIEDECDFELDEDWGVTSTDGLAIAGKKLGYDATIIRGVYQWSKKYNEYAVYDTHFISEL